MSTPNQLPPQPPRSGVGSTASLLGLVLLPLMVVICGGICAGVLFILAFHGESLAERAENTFQRVAAGGPVIVTKAAPMQPGVNDWMSQRVFAPVYTAAIDAVATNPQVIERLGEPVEPLEDAEELYRRIDTEEAIPPGNLGVPSGGIEFDVKGPKGSAVVTVVANTEEVAGRGYSALRAKTITVKFSDGTTIEVPAPKDQPGTEIR